MLSSKAGWLVKRNEQHVWQRRWCCVVPHTFLYYFEAAPHIDGDHRDNHGGHGVSGFFPSTTPSATADAAAASAVVENQDVLNAAVRDGLGAGNNNAGDGGDGDEKYYAAAATEGEMAEAALADPRGPMATSGSNLQPVGIIDLECYSNVNRTNRSEGVMELTGDPITNPDLRSFYFQAANADDAEEWTKAFLSDRHSGLKDELEAIREVCDTFPLQLRECADMIDRAEEKAATSEKELYRVRSAAEEGRRRALELVRDILDRRWVDDDAGSDSPSGGGGIKRTWSSDEKGDQGQLSAIQRKLLNGLEADRASVSVFMAICDDTIWPCMLYSIAMCHLLIAYMPPYFSSYFQCFKSTEIVPRTIGGGPPLTGICRHHERWCPSRHETVGRLCIVRRHFLCISWR